jgi:hypothetical protein
MYPPFTWICIIALTWSFEVPFFLLMSSVTACVLWRLWWHRTARYAAHRVVEGVTPSSQYLLTDQSGPTRVRISHRRDWLLVRLVPPAARTNFTVDGGSGRS